MKTTIRYKIKRNGSHNRLLSKTLSEGRVYIGGEKMLDRVVGILLDNKEAWIGTPERGGIRVFTVVRSDLSGAKPCAQSVGEFNNALNGVGIERVMNKKSSVLTVDDAKKQMKMDLERRHLGVTPDKMITFACEKCGHLNTVRVGKKLV